MTLSLPNVVGAAALRSSYPGNGGRKKALQKSASNLKAALERVNEKR